MLLMYRLKFILSSNCKPKSFIGHTTLICWLSIVIFFLVQSIFRLSNIIVWNFYGPTTTLFFLNKFMTTSDSDSNVLINPETVVAKRSGVFLSAKL